MKNLAFFFTLFTFIGTTSFGQTNPCFSSPIVGQSCVGECGMTGSLFYSGSCPVFDGFEVGVVESFCVTNESSSLCPSHKVIARAYVNGSLVKTQDITAPGSAMRLFAFCGSNVSVVASLVYAGGGICKRLGNVHFALHKN